jgi:hypothetical protein
MARRGIEPGNFICDIFIFLTGSLASFMILQSLSTFQWPVLLLHGMCQKLSHGDGDIIASEM